MKLMVDGVVQLPEEETNNHEMTLATEELEAEIAQDNKDIMKALVAIEELQSEGYAFAYFSAPLLSSWMPFPVAAFKKGVFPPEWNKLSQDEGVICELGRCFTEAVLLAAESVREKNSSKSS